MDVAFAYFLTPPISSILILLSPKKETGLIINSLYDDSPITEMSEDTLERNYKAIRMASEIIKSKSSQSIGFGITGSWGSGKTSFINLLKQEINKQNQNNRFIIVDFNPWLNLGIESIIKEFFRTIQRTLRPYGEDVYREIREYSNSLISLDKTNFTESFKEVLRLDSFFGESLSEEFKSLNTLLKKIDKRVVVFIDDFDRLQSGEIFEILKLIRNTGGFDNFIYVVAFDKDYVDNSLGNLKIPKPENFTEKIFFKEEHIIPATQIQIRNFLLKSLASKFDNKEEEIKAFFDTGQLVFREDNAIILDHLRDGKRFLNSFINDYKEIENEVVFSDYFYLKLLKFKFYDIYILLFLERDKFLNKRGIYYGEGGSKYHLKNKYENDNDSNFGLRFRDYKQSILGQYMLNQLGYSEEQIARVAKIMNLLFEVDIYQKKNHLSIIFEQNYHKYFKDNLRFEDLSEEEFNSTMELNFEEIKLKLGEWDKNNILELVRYRFYEIALGDINSREDYEKYVRCIFYFARMETDTRMFGKNFYGYDYSILRNFISNRNNMISEKFYDGNTEELKKFIVEVLEETDSPNQFESDFLNFVLNNGYNEDDFVLTKSKIEELLFDYLNDYIEGDHEVSSTIWSLFHNCRTVVDEKNDQGQIINKKSVYIDGVKELLIKYIENNLDWFLVVFIEPAPFYGHVEEDNKVGVSAGVKNNIFGSFENFEKWLKALDVENLDTPSLFYNEFLEFYEAFKKNNYENIEYQFNFIMIVEKLEGHKAR
ncbi:MULTISPECIES: KAP family P-loop NTPase fold protein [Flavobacteriaceae]|uniref:KAP family P-loop NTPase fold protein n=1 Tax=Flavobacteriaceae TaxID=49546 RepID=UPI00234BAC36|nr:P-loop NTPase fold protein [Muricauda sp. SP22]MDC6363310.1 P-loop NTPase fold protein [Muricauda sp. SP22]